MKSLFFLVAYSPACFLSLSILSTIAPLFTFLLSVKISLEFSTAKMKQKVKGAFFLMIIFVDGMLCQTIINASKVCIIITVCQMLHKALVLLVLVLISNSLRKKKKKWCWIYFEQFCLKVIKLKMSILN